jgi:hypothetical protein
MQSTVALPMSVPSADSAGFRSELFWNVKGTLCWVVGHADLPASAGLLRHPLFGVFGRTAAWASTLVPGFLQLALCQHCTAVPRSVALRTRAICLSH